MLEVIDLITEKIIIYVRLVDEVVIVYRPTIGLRLEDNIYEILPVENYYFLDEEWEFPPGKRVRCRRKIINGQPSLVAYEEVKTE
jgi:hypothetical protein